jgi:hypothetical protein
MLGRVYGFRNESAKTFGISVANQMDENLVTVYQLLGTSSPPLTPDEFEDILKSDLSDLAWWPYGIEYTILDSLTTPYFNHFRAEDIVSHLPWQLLDLQGTHNTLYVHATTCFESALDCWGYEKMLLAKLPADTNANILIIGAGVSGLLFALKLKKAGYKNIDILESTERYGGKTHTIKQDGPYPPNSQQPTYCELGTCYMSPAYNEMIKDLNEYHEGNEQISFSENVNRGIVTTGQLPENFQAPLVMNYGKYVLQKAEAELGYTPGFIDDKLTQASLLYEFAKYIMLHYKYFGGQFPMPSEPPKEFISQYGSKTFIEYLRDNDLRVMIGMLQYGYEVQGYGTLDKIPAFYGLVWITPPIIIAIIMDTIFPTKYQIPVVTAWSKGWGDIWDQIVTKEGLKSCITFNANITSIERNN